MSRALISVLCGIVGILAGDVVFRTSLLYQVRPVVLLPAEQTVVSPPVTVDWDGPTTMNVQLRVTGGPSTDFGQQRAPFTLTQADFPRDGGYELILEHPRFGALVSARRQFRILTAIEEAQAAPDPTTAAPKATTAKPKNLPSDRATPRAARARLYKRLRVLADENQRLHDENKRLAEEMESITSEESESTERSSESEDQLATLAAEQQRLLQDNALLQLRLSGVVPCSVWGYFSYPQAQFTSIPRRVLLVTDPGGNVFSTPAQCEWIRRSDTTAATSCFCVGNSFGG